MAFIDDLGLILDLLVLIAVAVFYTAVTVFWHWRKNDLDRASSHLREGAFVLGFLGAIILLIAIWGEFNWPLPGAFNLFFFDPLVMLGFLLVAFGAAVWFRLPTHFVGILSVVVGGGVVYYGYRAYTLSLTLDPLETYLMYIAFGALAILAYPATLFIDWNVVGPRVASVAPMVSETATKNRTLWYALLGLFLIVAVLAGVAVLIYGFDTAWAHLAAAP